VDEKFSDVKIDTLTEKSFVRFQRSSDILTMLNLGIDDRDPGGIKDAVIGKQSLSLQQLIDVANPSGLTIEKLVADNEIYEEKVLAQTASLFRAQSILSNALNCRKGTFEAKTVLDCVISIVSSAGRFANFNIELAALALKDFPKTLEFMQAKFTDEKFDYLVENSDQIDSFSNEDLVAEVEDFVSIHGHAMPFVSMAVAGKILSYESTLLALDRLLETEELKTSDAVQFELIVHVASLYRTNRVDKEGIENIVKKYGKHSNSVSFLRYIYFLYSRFIPIDTKDRQWLSSTLKVSLSSLRFNQKDMRKKHRLE